MEHGELLIRTGKAIEECAKRIAAFHSEPVTKAFVAVGKSDYFLRTYYDRLELLLGWLENHDGTTEQDDWIGDCLDEIKRCIEIYREVECAKCRQTRKAKINSWSGGKACGARCLACGTQIDLETK